MSEKKYSEKVVRYPAVTTDGKACEILERITYAHDVQPDGSLSEPAECNRRFDLRTGERVNHLGGDDYEIDAAGTRLRLQR